MSLKEQGARATPQPYTRVIVKGLFPKLGGGGLFRRSNVMNASVGSYLASRALARLGNKNWLLVFSVVISKTWKRKVPLPPMTLVGRSFHARLPSAVHLWNYTAQYANEMFLLMFEIPQNSQR